MQVGLILTAIEMPPRSWFGMVIEGQLTGAGRTGPDNAIPMFRPHLHALLLDVQFNSADRPRLRQPQQMLQYSAVSCMVISSLDDHAIFFPYPRKTRKRHTYNVRGFARVIASYKSLQPLAFGLST